MKTLLLLRHAKSSWKDADLTDHDRSLNKRGKRDAPAMGRLLLEKGLTPQQIISSTARRARDTAALIAEQSGFTGAIELNGDLYHAGPEALAGCLSQLYYEDDPVLLVAHNPGLERFLELLTGQYERLPTAALAQISLDLGDWSQLRPETRGTLENLWRPREMEPD